MAEEEQKVVKFRGSVAAVRSGVPAVAPAPLVSQSIQTLPVQRRRKRKFSSFGFISFFLFVILPTAVVATYLNFYATPRYSSEFRAVVRTAEPAKGAFPALIGLTGASQSSNDSQAVVQYLQSREPVVELNQSYGLREIYQNPSVDWWSRLKPDAAIEDLQKHWNEMVDVYYETSTGTIVVNVSAYKPEDALNIATTSLGLSESLINRMTSRVRDDTLSNARKEVTNAKENLKTINERLRVLRNKQSILDPRKAAESNLALSSKIRGDISQLNATLTQQLSRLSENSPPVKTTKGRISALEKELEKIGASMTSSNADDNALSTVIGDFDELENERAFAEKAFQSAMASLETARIDANRQQIYLATIVRPTLPENPSFPRPVYTTLLVLLAALTAWLVAMLLLNAVSDHS